MIAAYKIIFEQLDETEEDTFKLSDSMTSFGFDSLEKSSHQDLVNRNVLSNKGRNRV